MTNKIKGLARVLQITIIVFTSNTVQSAVITFDAFPTGSFGSGVENGFNVGSSDGAMVTGLGCTGNCLTNTSPSATQEAGIYKPDFSPFQFVSLEYINPFNLAHPDIILIGFSLTGTVTYDIFTVNNGNNIFNAVNLADKEIKSLSFTFSSSSTNSNSLLIDSITVSPASTKVPEPSFIVLIGLGLAVIGTSKSWRQKKLKA